MDIPILKVLREADLTIEGEFILGSNSTFFLTATWGGEKFPVVYKPIRGERPLWDFPAHTLAKREVAAFLVSQAMGWDLVPPTILRNNAPFGTGMVQLYIEHNPDHHYFNFSDEERQRLRLVAAFDLLINNADRKGSHVLVDMDGNIRCIDHGICFHVEEKLRTVIWDFAGQPIPPELVKDIQRFRIELSSLTGLKEELVNYLSLAEIEALEARAGNLINNPIFPFPPKERRSYPWPLV